MSKRRNHDAAFKARVALEGVIPPTGGVALYLPVAGSPLSTLGPVPILCG